MWPKALVYSQANRHCRLVWNVWYGTMWSPDVLTFETNTLWNLLRISSFSAHTASLYKVFASSYYFLTSCFRKFSLKFKISNTCSHLECNDVYIWTCVLMLCMFATWTYSTRITLMNTKLNNSEHINDTNHLVVDWPT